MYQAIAYFSYQNFEQDPVTLIDQVINQWRINGQIIGREIGVTHHQTQTYSSFQVRVAIPEQESLLPNWNSKSVAEALVQAEEAGVYFEYFEVVGRDYNAEQTSETPANFYILYTTYLDTCSPIYNGDHFFPVPLYRVIQNSELNEQIIQWQENWQACDQLQMNGNILEQSALSQISAVDSELSQQGRKIAQAIELANQTPTYYYLYRLGKDPEIEYDRKCPSCNQAWKLAEQFAIFQFKCDQCRLVSNLSWEIQ